MPKKKSQPKVKKTKEIDPINALIRELINEDNEIYEKHEILERIEEVSSKVFPPRKIPSRDSLVESLTEDLLVGLPGNVRYELELSYNTLELVEVYFDTDETEKVVRKNVKKWLKGGDVVEHFIEHPAPVRELLDKIEGSASSVFTKDDYIVLLQELLTISKEHKSHKIREEFIVSELIDLFANVDMEVDDFEVEIHDKDLGVSEISIDRDCLEEEIQGALEDLFEQGELG
jgi:hypothetical protein